MARGGECSRRRFVWLREAERCSPEDDEAVVGERLRLAELLVLVEELAVTSAVMRARWS